MSQQLEHVFHQSKTQKRWRHKVVPSQAANFVLALNIVYVVAVTTLRTLHVGRIGRRAVGRKDSRLDGCSV